MILGQDNTKLLDAIIICIINRWFHFLTIINLVLWSKSVFNYNYNRNIWLNKYWSVFCPPLVWSLDISLELKLNYFDKHETYDSRISYNHFKLKLVTLITGCLDSTPQIMNQARTNILIEIVWKTKANKRSFLGSIHFLIQWSKI